MSLLRDLSPEQRVYVRRIAEEAHRRGRDEGYADGSRDGFAEGYAARNGTQRRTPTPVRAATASWLAGVLAAGPVAATDVLRRCAAEGFSERTLRAAKADLGVTSARIEGQWWWVLPSKAAQGCELVPA